MTSSKCPNCGAINSESTLVCDCGHQLAAGQSPGSDAPKSTRQNRANALRATLAACAGIPIALLYGILARWVFTAQRTAELWNLMTLSFLFIIPVVIGALTVYLAPRIYRTSGRFVFFMPWLACLLATGVAALFAWEATVCIAMALPIFLPLSSLGGLLFKLPKSTEPPSAPRQNITLGLILAAPYLLSPIEMQMPQAHSYRVVENTILISASSATVWENIVAVPRIQPHEQRPRVFHLLGLPKPLEATLDERAVGGVRSATYEEGLTFVETIAEWEELQRLRFSIERVDTPGLRAPLHQIGGDYFDVLEATYSIEPAGDGQVRLRLRSTHRLSTHFNRYGGIWTDYLMYDLQGYILGVIKMRAEAQ